MTLEVSQQIKVTEFLRSALESIGLGDNEGVFRAAQSLLLNDYTRLDRSVGAKLFSVMQQYGSREYLAATAKIQVTLSGLQDLQVLAQSTDENARAYGSEKASAACINFTPAVAPGLESDAFAVMQKVSAQLRELGAEAAPLFAALKVRWPELLTNSAAQDVLVELAAEIPEAVVAAGFLGFGGPKSTLRQYKKRTKALFVSLRKVLQSVAALLKVPKKAPEPQVVSSEAGALDILFGLFAPFAVAGVAGSFGTTGMAVTTGVVAAKFAYWAVTDSDLFARQIARTAPYALLYALGMTFFISGLLGLVSYFDEQAALLVSSGLDQVVAMNDPVVFNEGNFERNSAWAFARLVPSGGGYILTRKVIDAATGKSAFAADVYVNIWSMNTFLGNVAAELSAALTRTFYSTDRRTTSDVLDVATKSEPNLAYAIAANYLACLLFVLAGRQLATGIRFLSAKPKASNRAAPAASRSADDDDESARIADLLPVRRVPSVRRLPVAQELDEDGGVLGRISRSKSPTRGKVLVGRR